ncbi:MAG: hypothetical protein GY851_08410, partial [bacterium]|nr:hypothetical protein [bacterium]
MRHITKSERRFRSVFLHGVLVAGSFLFSIPFIWLFSTSCKVPDEIYPPKWVPQIPEGVVESPYIKIRQNEHTAKPVGVKSEDWNRVREPIMAAIGREALAMSDRLPEFYHPYLEERDIADGVFYRLIRRAPDELFTKQEAEVTAWFAKGVGEELVRYVFETVYRRVAVSDVVFHGWDVISVEYPTADKEYPWNVVDGDATLVERREGLLREAREVHYNFDDSDVFSLQITVPIEMDPSNLKKIVVSNHCDRSWHEIHATI